MRRKSRRNNLKLGDSNAIDDITGFKHKRSEMRKLSGEQKGLLTHKRNWNPPHPQLKIKGRTDKIAVEDTRVRPADDFSDPPTQDDL
jgi:hypothetical protein